MTISTLAWVTTAAARGLDEDEDVALTALRRTGVAVRLVDWDDPEVDWSTFDRVALRSTWDYDDRLDEFVAWLVRVDAVTELVNALPAVLWSTDKRYLGELEAAGVPVTPTRFVPPGTVPEFPPGRFVVKPAVGAGSRGAAAYGPAQHTAATEHVASLHADRQVVLVQPFVASVPVEGEWPLVFLGGRYSHAASKRVALPEAAVIEDLFAPETTAAHRASTEQVEVAGAAMRVVTERFGPLPYARVDLVRADDGSSLVLEVELVEPSLFLAEAAPGAADRLAAALTGPLDGPPQR